MPQALPDTPGPQTLGGTKPRDDSYAHLASCSQEVLTREGPPGCGLPLCPLRPLPVPHPHPSPAAPTQAAPSPMATSPQNTQPQSPPNWPPQAHLTHPPCLAPWAAQGAPRQPETAQSSQCPAVPPPTCLSHGNPSNALPSPLYCIPDCLLLPPTQPWGPWATSQRRHCPPGAISWKGHGGEGRQRCPQVPEEYEETPCLDLVAGSPSTLHTPHSQRGRPPTPRPRRSGQNLPALKLIPREARHQGLCSGEKTQGQPRRLQER